MASATVELPQAAWFAEVPTLLLLFLLFPLCAVWMLNRIGRGHPEGLQRLQFNNYLCHSQRLLQQRSAHHRLP
jgi:hypothetical protein